MFAGARGMSIVIAFTSACSYDEKFLAPDAATDATTDATTDAPGGGSGAVARPASTHTEHADACGDTCVSFRVGSVVQLTPAAAAGSRFVGWAGACTGIARCELTMDRPHVVVAMFAREGADAVAPALAPSPDRFATWTDRERAPLQVITSGDGAGRVTSSMSD